MIGFLTRVELANLVSPDRFDPALRVLDLAGACESTLGGILNYLLQTVHDTTILHHVQLEGRKYFPHSNSRISAPEDAVYHPDSESDSDTEESDSDGEDERPEDNQDFQYHLKFHPNYQDEGVLESYLEDEARHPETVATVQSVHSWLEAATPEELQQLKIRFDGPLHITNCSGFNEDRRGGDTTSVKLDFHDEWDIQLDADRCITFGQLAEACFRLKSHKFEGWYELFGDATVKLTRSGITVTLSYDHGS